MGNKHKITIGLFALAVAVCWAGAVSGSAQDAYLTTPPPELNLPAGSWISIRVNQPLSSDRNQPGDYFIGSLAQPLVAYGLVIAAIVAWAHTINPTTIATWVLAALVVIGIGQLLLNLVRAVVEVNRDGDEPDTTPWELANHAKQDDQKPRA